MAIKTRAGREIDQYYNRFDEQKNYADILLRDGYATQASEMNELQSIFSARVKRIADSVFKDGDIVSRGSITVDPETGLVQAEDGVFYIAGDMYSVPAAEFTIPVRGVVPVGLFLEEEIISEIEDPTLCNPARGTKSEGYPGAWRRKKTARWGVAEGEAQNFYLIYTVEDGYTRAKETPPTFDALSQAIARYDVDSTDGGTYICSGINVTATEDDEETGAQIYSISKGRYRVCGLGVEFQQDRRLTYAAAPAANEVVEVVTETVIATGEGTQHVTVAHRPIWKGQPVQVSVPRRETVTTMIHGPALGVADPLPNNGVLRIISVTQGGTTFTAGTDYVRTGDTVDWAPGGDEPAPGSTYTVTYDYMAREEAQALTWDGFDVTGAVEGQGIIYSYFYALSRIDLLCLDADGVFHWLNGVASERNVKSPAVPENLLKIATVKQTWRDLDSREVISDGIRSYSFEAVALLFQRAQYLIEEVARTRLENDISTREDGARVGMFVDPFLDDDMRDQGLEQTAAIVNGCLTLPISATAYQLTGGITSPAALPVEYSIALQQTLRTGSMLVNPYQSFEPLPANCTISPAVDRWSETKTSYTSSETQTFNKTEYIGYNRATETKTTSSTSVVSTKKESVRYLRQITISYSVNGFGPGENLASVTFAGIRVSHTGANTADSQGRLSGSFVIPANVPTGTKSVVFTGQGGSKAYATFVGEGTITYRTLKTTYTVTVTRFVNTDPLAQTFSLETPLQLAGIDLWFTAKGSSKVLVQLVECSNGYPTQTVLAEGEIQASAIVLNTWTRVLFSELYQGVTLAANTEYAFVVKTDDAKTACAVAEMGKFDTAAQRWVSAQPYTIGVLLSSSNASTWTAHQTMDLTFRLVQAKPTAQYREVDLGSVTGLDDVSDLILYAASETPDAGSSVKFSISLPNGTSLTVDDDQAVALSSILSGEFGVKATLAASGEMSPAVAADAQIIIGRVAHAGTYYSRSVIASNATYVMVVFDAEVPAGSSVTAELQQDGGTFAPMTLEGTLNQGNGVYEFKYRQNVSNVDLVKLKLTLRGTASARPRVYDLRLLAVH